MAEPNRWTWSAQHLDHYRVVWDPDGQPEYIWSKTHVGSQRRDESYDSAVGTSPLRSGPGAVDTTSNASNINREQDGRASAYPPLPTNSAEKSARCTASFKDISSSLRNAPEQGRTLKSYFSNENDRFQLWNSSFDVDAGGLDRLSPEDSDLVDSILESLESYLTRYKALLDDDIHTALQDEHFITHVRHTLRTLFELSPVLEYSRDFNLIEEMNLLNIAEPKKVQPGEAGADELIPPVKDDGD
ncbi:uncharacterized protein BDZ99DRAFT_195361 [Mytilinidion resinicola]|uniref:Uncharacterized protein n=1 Tax=Mytilinidion resinicola TaxID=574789 RepID=A0A6A6Z573_9PEZI|nr:uncharacterized protein BDZ99DRAFT_195361 [Mytilinidion resinicola]KAF2815407.1 hypothetical protein BDZ99DRAFT_195361 [Mytilinidion resinicola]